MIPRLLSLLLAFALAGPAAATCTGASMIDALSPEDRAALDAAVAAAPYPEGNYWRAEKPGSTVHVVGTIHIPDPRLDAVAARVRPTLKTADLLILEATTAMQADMQRLMTSRPDLAFLTEGPSLIDLLGDETWNRLTPELQARGIPPFLAAKFRPWLLSMTLAIPQCALTAMTAGETGLDGRLEVLARAQGLPIATLDDMEAVLDLLAGGSLEEEVDMLRIALDTGYDMDAATATTLDSYFAERHRELWEFSRLLARGADVGDESFEAFEADLLDGRNTAWAAELPALLDGRNAVIAVGAAHLSGETGILRTLERLGYSLTRL